MFGLLSKNNKCYMFNSTKKTLKWAKCKLLPNSLEKGHKKKERGTFQSSKYYSGFSGGVFLASECGIVSITFNYVFR